MTKKRFFNIQAGYSLAQRAVNAIYGLDDQFDYFEDFVDHREEKFVQSAAIPQKHTLLHIFLENYEIFSLESELYDMDHSENFDFFDYYLHIAKLSIPDWFNNDEINEHSEELKPLVYSSAKIVAQSAFEILFNDREFLYEFQLRIKEAIETEGTPHPSKFFEPNGRIRRLNRLPKWLQRAFYHRDRGRCQLCFKDVSGEVYQYSIYHADHVLSLASGGTNDPTNFQLLCKECNLRKGRKENRPNNQQVRFWELQ